jgi:hypothetical protein
MVEETPLQSQQTLGKKKKKKKKKKVENAEDE